MKLVTVWRKRSILVPEYVPGRCNIGRRGRAIRLTTGLVLIAVSIVIGITVLEPVNNLLSLTLVVPFYVGVLACLEGSMFFCVLRNHNRIRPRDDPGLCRGRSQSFQSCHKDRPWCGPLLHRRGPARTFDIHLCM